MEPIRSAQLKSVTLSGFLGYRDPVTVSFDSGVYGIVGRNQTSEGADSNGAGKSSLCDGIDWLLFGETPRRLSADDVVNVRAPEAQAAGEFTVCFGDNGQPHIFSIVRTKKRGDSQRLSLFLDGERLPEERIADCQKIISEWLIGVTGHDDFLNLFYIADGAPNTFLSADTDPAERHRALYRLLNFELYDRCRSEAGSRRRDAETRIGVIEPTLRRCVEGLKLIGDPAVMESESKALAERHSERVRYGWLLDEYRKLLDEANRRESALRELGTKCGTAVKLVADLRASLDGLTTVEDVIDPNEVERLEAERVCWVDDRVRIESEWGIKLESLESDRRRVHGELAKAKQEVSRLQALQRQALVCPDCLSSLMLTNGVLGRFDLTELGMVVERAEKSFETLQGESTKNDGLLADYRNGRKTAMSSGESRLADLDGKLAGLRARRDAAVHYQSQLSNFRARLADAERQEQTSQNEYASFNEGFLGWLAANLSDKRFAGLSQLTLDADRTQVASKIQSIRDRIVRLESDMAQWSTLAGQRDDLQLQLNTSAAERDACRHWEDRFPQIRDAIMGEFIPLFEVATNRQLVNLKMSERVEFSLSAVTKSGSVIRRFSTRVFDGHAWRPAQSCSSGEWRRIAVSVGLALRELLLQRAGAFQFFMCDEVADRLDPLGLSLFLKNVTGNGGTSLVVSHRPMAEIGGYVDRIITVTKDEDAVRVEVSGP